MNFERLRACIAVALLDLWERMKPERIQDRILEESDTPMTLERTRNRAAASGFELLFAPVAIQKRYRHADFEAALDFVSVYVRQVAVDQGQAPKVEIDGGDVVVTLGIPIPGLLSEADFDVADALKQARSDADADAEGEGEGEDDLRPTPRNG